MRPIPFKECNCTFGENQKEYRPFPALRNKEGDVVLCWGLSFKERVILLFTGKLWWGIRTFNKPMTPQHVTVKKSDLFTVTKQKEKR